MKEKEFSLLDKPWIRVRDQDCGIHEISLMELFGQAHLYKDLCGELQTQDFAILRLLLAVLHTVFSRYDCIGEKRLFADEDEAIDCWAELWERKRFPAEVIADYLESQRESFYLFHPERPFYQCEHAQVGTEYSAPKLNGSLSESSNKLRLFTDASGKIKGDMSFSEAARWLVYVNAYDDTSAKPSREAKGQETKLPSVGTGWLGKLGIVFVAGDNLFETLMLNLIMVKENGELYGKETPLWEREQIPDGERTQIGFPDNLSELYTLQSRRVYLKRNNWRVTGYHLLGGDFFERENAFIEPMTVWRTDKKTNCCTPKRHDASKQFWRECPAAIFNDDQGNRRPGIISWVKRLEEEEIIQNPRLDIRIVSVQYGDKDFFVTNVFSDSLQMHSALIADLNITWQQAVLDSISFCEEIAKKVWSLAKNINLAAGGSDSTKESKGTAAVAAEKAKADFYNRIDRPFRLWLSTLNPETDHAEEKKAEWRGKCVNEAKRLGNEMMSQVSAEAIFGRSKLNGEDNREQKTFSAARAMNWFLFELRVEEKS